MKHCLKEEHALPSMFWISFFLLLLSVAFVGSINFILSWQTMLLIAVKSLILAFAWYFVTHALRKMDVSLVAPMRNISPVFLLFLSFFILNEKLSLLQYFGVFVVIGGSYILELRSIKRPFEPFLLLKSKRFLLLLLALVLMSICAIMDKYIMFSLNFQTYMFYNYVFLTIFVFCFIFFKKHHKTITQPLKHHYHYFILISLLLFFADMLYLYVVAMPGVPISLIIPLKRLSGVFTVFFGGRLMHEERIMHKGMASCLMVCGLFFLFV